MSSAPPSQCCTIAARRSFHIASTSGERARISGSSSKSAGRPLRPRASSTISGHGASTSHASKSSTVSAFSSRCAVLPASSTTTITEPLASARARHASASSVAQVSATGPEPPPDDPPLESESSSTRFRIAKAPAIKSKATANATRRRAIAGRVFAGRDSTAAAVLRLRDAHRPLVGSAVPSGVAQPAEQRTVNPLVESSSLSPGARRACSSVVRAGDS